MEAGAEPVGAAQVAAPGSQEKRIAYKVLAGLFAAVAFGGLFLSAFVVWFDNGDGGIHRVHDMGYGALGAILMTGFLAQNWRPERKISAFYQILVVALASGIGGAIATSVGALVGAFIAVAYVVLLVLHPYRSEVLHPQRAGFSPVLMGLTILGAIPLIWYSLAVAKLQRNGIPADSHAKMDHWTTMAAMAISIVLVALLSALRFRGWRISARSAGAAIFLYGLISTVYPHKAGSEGTGWGLVAMAGGLVFVGAAEWEARRALPSID
ncbi:MAG: hypothetical protein ACRDH6_04225 [Actinomycetota bacterium]